MPNYDYRCVSCEDTFEVFHSIKDKPVVVCPSCGHKGAKKIPSLCGISIRQNTTLMRKYRDSVSKQNDMRKELRESYGLHTINPLGGNTISDVYRDVRSRGNFVREEMAKSAEESAAKTKAKQKEWKRKAAKRAPARGQEMVRRQASEAAAKRAMSIQSR